MSSNNVSICNAVAENLRRLCAQVLTHVFWKTANILAGSLRLGGYILDRSALSTLEQQCRYGKGYSYT